MTNIEFNNSINRILQLCRIEVDEVKITLEIHALSALIDRIPGDGIVGRVKRMIKRRFDERGNTALPNMGYNPSSVLCVQRAFYENFNVQLNLALHTHHVGSVLEILQNLHTRLDRLEQKN